MLIPGKSKIILLVLVSIWCPSLLADTEKEPNNFENEATLVTGASVDALINDDKDWFRVHLPATGPVTVRLSGLPGDLQAQLGVKDFPHVGWQDGKGEIQYSFDAENAEGLIWVQFQWARSLCGSDWCAVKYSPGGAWYAIQPSQEMPAMHEGQTVIRQVPGYVLSIETSASPSPGAASSQGRYGEDQPAPESQIIWEEG